MLNLCNNTSCTTADIVGCFLSVVFTIVHFIALGVLLFFKMYRKFIYRLLLYAYVAGIITSISWTAHILATIKVQGQQVEFQTFTNCSISSIFQYIYLGNLPLFSLLLTSMNLCIYILAIHHHQFTSWVADIIFLMVCLIFSQMIATSFLVISRLPYQSPATLPIEVTNITCKCWFDSTHIGANVL